MTDNLSFTESLRENGFIENDVDTQTTSNDTNTEEASVETIIEEEVSNESTQTTEETTTSENVAYIGNKPVMNYVLAVVTRFDNGLEDISIKARGRAISRAVDVAEIVRNRFIPEVKVEKIETSTEELITNAGTSSNVSTITIKLVK